MNVTSLANKFVATHPRRLAGVAACMTAAAVAVAGCGSASARRPARSESHRPPHGPSGLYVGDSPALIPIDVADHRAGKPIALPRDSAAVAVAPNRRTAYVTSGPSVIPIDLATGTAGKSFAVPGISAPLVIGHDSRTGYLMEGSDIIVLDLRAEKVDRRIAVRGLSINTLMLSASGRMACVTGTTGPNQHVAIERVDLGNGRTGKPISVPGLLAAALAPDGRTAYVASANLLLPINLGTGRVGRAIKTPMLGIGAIAITADGRTAYVGNAKPQGPNSGVLVPIDLATGAVQPPIHVPSYPYSITDILIAKNQRTAYAAAYSSVIAIDLATMRPEPRIRMPVGTHAIILAP